MTIGRRKPDVNVSFAEVLDREERKRSARERRADSRKDRRGAKEEARLWIFRMFVNL